MLARARRARPAVGRGVVAARVLPATSATSATSCGAGSSRSSTAAVRPFASPTGTRTRPPWRRQYWRSDPDVVARELTAAFDAGGGRHSACRRGTQWSGQGSAQQRLALHGGDPRALLRPRRPPPPLGRDADDRRRRPGGPVRCPSRARPTRARRRRIRWGILGPGLHRATRSPMAVAVGTSSTVVAVGSRSERPGPGLRRRVRCSAGLRVLRGARRRRGVDAVYVASPHSEHRDHALLALEAGKPVLVEKAFTRNAAEAREVIAGGDARGACSSPRRCGAATCRTTTSCARSSRPASRRPRRSSSPTTASGSTPTARSDWPQPELAGGALLDLGVYPVSFADLCSARPPRLPPVALSATGVSTRRSAWCSPMRQAPSPR